MLTNSPGRAGSPKGLMDTRDQASGASLESSSLGDGHTQRAQHPRESRVSISTSHSAVSKHLPPVPSPRRLLRLFHDLLLQEEADDIC